MALALSQLGTGIASIRNESAVEKRCRGSIRVKASRREYSIWSDDEAADGKAVDAEEGIFERVVERAPLPRAAAKARIVAKPIEVPSRGLVPEKWRELQDDLNKTKREKRRELLQERNSRSKEEKAKLREKLSSIIEEAIEQEKIQEESSSAELTHTVFEGGGRQVQRVFYQHEDDSDDFSDDPSEDDPERQSEEEWPPVSGHSEPKLVEFSGRATPRNPRTGLGDLTIKAVSEKMKVVEPPAEKIDLDDDNSCKGVFLTPEEKKLFRKRDPDIDKISCEKWMPLHTLASSGQAFLVGELMQQGVHVDSVNKDGVTALCRAVQVGRLAVVKHLIRGGADVFFRDKDGATLLHHAVVSANPSVVRLVLKHGVHINSVDKAGWTPLHLAVQGQKRDILRALLKRGADWTIANKDGNTPIDLAFGFGSGFNTNAVIKILKTQKPVLGSMRGFKGCEEIARRLESEGVVDDAKTHEDKDLVELSSETQRLLVKVKDWANNDLL